MQRILAIFGHWVHGLALALWFGGVFAIGALVAPAAFRQDRHFAGIVVGESFRKLNLISFVCAGLMLAATWVEWRVQSAAARRLLFVRAALTAAAFALSLYLGIRLFPMMIGLRGVGQMADFDRLHQLYGAVTQVQVSLLAAGALITALLALPRGNPGIQVFRYSGVQETGEVVGERPNAPAAEHLNTRTPEYPNTGAKRP